MQCYRSRFGLAIGGVMVITPAVTTQMAGQHGSGHRVPSAVMRIRRTRLESPRSVAVSRALQSEILNPPLVLLYIRKQTNGALQAGGADAEYQSAHGIAV